MSVDVEHRIRAHLEEQASKLQPDGAGVEAALDLGRRMARRRTVFTSVAAVVFVVLGVAGAFAVREAIATDPDPNPPDAQGTTIAPPGGSTQTPILGNPVGSSGGALAALDWYAVEATLGYSTKLLSGDDGLFYALSTAPGQGWTEFGPPDKALYTSEDGETWSAVILEGDIGVSDIAVRGGTIYAVGTAPGFSAIDGTAAAYNLGTSTDGGETWNTTLLDTSAVPPENLTVNWVDATAHIAAGPKGVVAATATRFQVDLFALVPREVLGESTDVRPTADGIEVVDYMFMERLDMECSQEMDALGGDPGELAEDELPEPCRQLFSGEHPDEAIVYSATWEELGFEANPLNIFELFVSTDGTTFESVPSPFTADEWIRGIYAVGDGYLSLGWGLNSSITRYSPDGRTWTQLDSLPAMNDISQVGTFGGAVVLIGFDFNGRPVVLISDGSGGWDRADLSDVLGDLGENVWLSASAIGDQGIVMAVQTWDEATQINSIRLVRGNGIDEWEEVALADIMGSAEDGYVEWLVVGKESVIGRVMVGGRFGPPTSMQLVGTLSK